MNMCTTSCHSILRRRVDNDEGMGEGGWVWKKGRINYERHFRGCEALLLIFFVYFQWINFEKGVWTVMRMGEAG